MSGKKHYRLCSSCRNSATCILPKRKNAPVLQCEEFSPILKTGTRRKSQKHSKAFSVACKLKGLCRICGKLKDCVYPKPQSGIWHCEEYE